MWKLSGTATPDGYNIFHIKMTLDRQHGDVPDQIQVQRGPNVKTYQVTMFRQYQGTWVPTEVQMIEDTPIFGRTIEAWKLQRLEPSSPFTLTIPPGETVQDFRLLASVPTWDMIQQAQMGKKSDVVHYFWSGSFPSLNELKRLFSQQHPGEGSPDPDGPTSMLPTVGGLMCLAVGLLTYRRRPKGDA